MGCVKTKEKNLHDNESGPSVQPKEAPKKSLIKLQEVPVDKRTAAANEVRAGGGEPQKR